MGALSVIRAFRFFAGPILAGLAVGLAVLWWYEWGPNARPGRYDSGTASYAGAVNHAAPAVVNIYTT
ncbi:MAG: 2-alkenal reductase, partial [Alcanivorax sp.]